MRGRLGRLAGALALLLSLVEPASAQFPLLDTLSRDPTDDAAYGALPWASLTNFPTPCDPGYFIQGQTAVSYDCQPIAAGTPTNGDCPKWNSGTGQAEWGPCGTSVPLVVLGDDYCYLGVGGTDKLIYYTGS